MTKVLAIEDLLSKSTKELIYFYNILRVTNRVTACRMVKHALIKHKKTNHGWRKPGLNNFLSTQTQ